MKYQPVIGLEIHVQLKTKSKMFCSCLADTWQTEPNSHTCPVCLGLPGAIPTINRLALEQVVRMAQGLNCQINVDSFFERKNYFYPDLPKGFQISQHRKPIGINGFLELRSLDNKRIDILDVHLEEDTGKSIHTSTATLLDFNKSGLPLMEIVSAPEMTSSEEALGFSHQIYQLVRWLEVSEADMEKGQMRLELNISLRKSDTAGLPSYKVEVKNINSFKYLKQAIEFEIKRQTEIFESGETPKQENRGFDDDKGVTVSQREKEEAHDYRYFPEPDLPPLRLEPKPLVEILPEQAFDRLLKEFKLPMAQAEQITREKSVYLFFEELVKEGMGPVEAANIIINKPAVLQEEPRKIVENLKVKSQSIISNKGDLSDLVQKVLDQNPKAVGDYKGGKTDALKFLMGQVMKESKGQADPQITMRILEEQLNK